MGTNVRQNIVTNGLVLYLDAGSRMSYNSGSTTWRDLSGNNYSGSLINGPIFSNENQGNIVFDGVNDYVTLSSGSGINVGVTFTLQTWVKVTRFGGFSGGNWNRASIISNSYPYTANQGFYLCCTSQNPAASNAATPGYETFFLSLGQDNSFRTAQYGSLTNYVNKWVNLSAVVVNSATPIRLYINGIETAYANNSNGLSSLLYSARPCFLGTNNGLSEYTAANIGLFTMYNRALSQQELNQNYNATKNRFGLF